MISTYRASIVIQVVGIVLLSVIQAKMGAKMGVKKPVLGALVWSVPMQLQPVLAYQTLANTIA